MRKGKNDLVFYYFLIILNRYELKKIHVVFIYFKNSVTIDQNY